MIHRGRYDIVRASEADNGNVRHTGMAVNVAKLQGVLVWISPEIDELEILDIVYSIKAHTDTFYAK